MRRRMRHWREPGPRRIGRNTMERNRETLERFRLAASLMSVWNRLADDLEPAWRVICDPALKDGTGFSVWYHDELQVHIAPVEPFCDHEWNNGGGNPTHCVKCGYSFARYVHGLF